MLPGFTSTAFSEAITFINGNPEEIAKIETEYLALDSETVKSYLNEKDCQFFPELRGAETMAEFMVRAGFIEKGITMDAFRYDGVSGN